MKRRSFLLGVAAATLFVAAPLLLEPVEAASQPTYSYSPDDFGATAAMRAGTDDSSAVWNNLFAQVRADALAGVLTKPIDASGGKWRLVTSVNATGINPNGNRSGFELKNGFFVGETIGRPMLDLTDSGYYSIHDTVLFGSSDPTKTPAEAVQVAIGASGSAGSWSMSNVSMTGSFSQAAFIGYGYESAAFYHCHFYNTVTTAAVFVGEGNPSHTYSNLYAAVSGVAQSFTNNVYSNCIFQPIPAAAFITGVTRANPAVVTLSSPVPYSNGDTIVIVQVGGMSGQINMRRFTVAGVSGSTFQLSGVNSTDWPVYVSGGLVYPAQTVSTLYLNRASHHTFQNCYCVNLGSHAVEFFENIADVQAISGNTFDIQIEGFGTISEYWLNNGSQPRAWVDCSFDFGTSALTSAIATSATTTGLLVFYNTPIRVPIFFGPIQNLPMLDQPAKYQMLGAEILYPATSGFDPAALALFSGTVTFEDTITSTSYSR